MIDIPLHPAIVHIPIGLALVAPLLTLALAIAWWRNKLPRWSFALAVALQAVVLAGGLLAMNTGEQDEERVEEVVPESAIEEHEEAAEFFVWTAGVTLAIGVATLLLPGRSARWGFVLTTVATVVVAVLAIRTGHAGGKLVYQHGAASVHTEKHSPAGQQPDLVGEKQSEREDDD